MHFRPIYIHGEGICYVILRGENRMGTVHAELTLKNACDVSIKAKGLIKDHEVHQITVKAVADTGAMSLVINEEIQQKLDLRITDKMSAVLANGKRANCLVTEPVEVHWKNRKMTCDAVLVPGAKHVLLGAIPLEGMDLMVNPVTQELVGVHGEKELILLL